MKFEVNNKTIKLEFEKVSEVSHLLNTLILCKHYSNRINPALNSMSSIHWFDPGLLLLGNALNEVLPNLKASSLEKSLLENREINENSESFKHILERLAEAYLVFPGKEKISRRILKSKNSSRKWVRAYFAPIVLCDDLADLVVENLLHVSEENYQEEDR